MKILKKILIILLLLLMLFSLKCFAMSVGNVVSYNGTTTTVPEIKTGSSREDNLSFTTSPRVKSGELENLGDIINKFEDGEAAVGIDVSKWQGDIDWEKVAESGVKFAMIRCGYRGTQSGTIYEDEYFHKNIQGAINNGIYVGVYFYSAAITEEEALQEAATVVEMIKVYDIKYPVVYDFEEFTPKGYRTDNLSVEQINKNAHMFLGYIKANGYESCLYGSSSYLKNTWKMSEFSDHNTWVAHYYVSKPSYTGKYDLWQYTDKASIPGITTGGVDVNIDYSFYFKYNNIDILPYMFDSYFYADKYPDLKAVFGYNEVLLREHYNSCGKREGRMATPVFDAMYYLNKYSDLKSAFGTNYELAYEHFVNTGIKEGRVGSKYFDVRYYLNNNKDLKKVFYSSTTKSLEHYILNGMNEKRVASPEFDLKNYYDSTSKYVKRQLGIEAKKYIALADGGNPINDSPIDITNYMFDARYYADNNSDLKAIYGYDEGLLRLHYDIYGKIEGRIATEIFDPVYYVNTYPDLKEAFGTNYEVARNHFINNGIHEGRARKQ